MLGGLRVKQPKDHNPFIGYDCETGPKDGIKITGTELPEISLMNRFTLFNVSKSTQLIEESRFIPYP